MGFELGLRLGLVLLDFITKCLRARNMRQAFSNNNWPTGSLFIGYEKGDKHELICDITCADNIKQNFKVKHWSGKVGSLVIVQSLPTTILSYLV